MMTTKTLFMWDLTWLASTEATGSLVTSSLFRVDLSLTFIEGGKLTNNDTVVNIGLQLTDACWNTYASTAYVSPTGPVPVLIRRSQYWDWS
jgi:hypothetical protein